MYDHLVRIHQTLWVTPAVAAVVMDKLWGIGGLASWWKMLERPRDHEGSAKSSIETRFDLLVWLLTVLVWLTGLISTVYLVGNALYLLFLAVVFGQYSPGNPTSEYLALVAKNAIPACGFTAIGITSLRFWSSKRLRILGLLAISVETALAICVFVDPEIMLIIG